ncbi:MAG: hypothetical protein O2923_01610 [Verrucomicrobia bacterium]|nr:hypothetical protein [Verrucomicrobiota bacterium]MDA1085687.1 hypothetical protein [Verrucomicrobiota bacterium]
MDRSGATVLIAASYPKAEMKNKEALLKAAVLSATFGTPTDPADALAFTATPAAPFQVAKILGQNMILSPDGRFPVNDEKVPFMILGLSAERNTYLPVFKKIADSFRMKE